MPKCRLLGVVVAKGNWAVQSLQFRRHLPIGRTTVVIDYLNRWGIDEIILLDMDATRQGRGPLYDNIVASARPCRVPLAVGGGIHDLGAMERLLRSGADKVVLNTAALDNPKLITEGACKFGDQCILVSMDVRSVNGEYEVVRLGNESTSLDPVELAVKVSRLGAGEIFLNSVDRDGTRQGYDLELMSRVSAAVSIPVIACGGVGTAEHFREALRAGITSVAAANYFNWCEHSVALAKRFLSQQDVDVRHDTLREYDSIETSPRGRLAGANEALLEQLRFTYIEDEVI